MKTIMKRFLLQHGNMMMIVLQHGNTALHEAAWKGFSLTLSFLCQVAMLNICQVLNCKYLFSKIFCCIVSIYFSLHPLAAEHIQISKLQISLKSLNIFLFNVSKHFKQLTFVEDFERYFSATNVVLQSRANVYMKNRGGFTALHLCCQVSFTF